jgi:hypothetical protein
MKYTTLDYFEAQEATFDLENARARVVIVRPGVSKNRKNWTPAALQKAVDAKIFDGIPMYLGHAPRGTSRNLLDLKSAIESTELGPEGEIAGNVTFIDKEFAARAQAAKKFFGTSIDVLFDGQKVKGRDGLPQWDVNEIVVANSVDWVPNPAAGGGIDRFLSAQESEDVIDWSKVTLEDLQKNRPDLLPASESGDGKPPAQGNPPPSGDAAPVTKAELKQALEEAHAEWEKGKAQEAAAQRQVAARINAAALPARTKTRLIASFDGVNEYKEADVDAAVKSAQEELKEAGAPGPKVVGLGNTGDGTDQPKDAKEIQQALESTAPVHSILTSAFHMKAQEDKK